MLAGSPKAKSRRSQTLGDQFSMSTSGGEEEEFSSEDGHGSDQVHVLAL